MRNSTEEGETLFGLPSSERRGGARLPVGSSNRRCVLDMRAGLRRRRLGCENRARAGTPAPTSSGFPAITLLYRWYPRNSRHDCPGTMLSGRGKCPQITRRAGNSYTERHPPEWPRPHSSQHRNRENKRLRPSNHYVSDIGTPIALFFANETTSRAFPQARDPYPLSRPPDPSTRASDLPRSLASSFSAALYWIEDIEQDVPPPQS
jgi:hypothetical protein